MEIAIPAVERAFAAHGRGEALMPPKLDLPLEKYGGAFRPMPALLGDASAEAAERFAKEAGGFVASMDQAGSCDIICTSTPSRSPVLFRSYVGISTHINAMGADAPGKQELDPRLLHDATVVVDDWA